LDFAGFIYRLKAELTHEKIRRVAADGATRAVDTGACPPSTGARGVL